MSAHALAADEVHVWRYAFEDGAPALAALTVDELRRAERYVFAPDRARYLATRAMLREVLSRYAEPAPQDWGFDTNAAGRPSIREPALSSPLHFNLSHAGGDIVCAVGRCAEIGIDIEYRVPAEYLEIAERYFAAGEFAWLKAAPDAAEAGRRFLDLWTLKEAYLKARGTGLSLPLAAFALVPGPQGVRLDAAPDFDDRAAHWHFTRRRERGDGAFALAVRLPEGERPRVSAFEFTR